MIGLAFVVPAIWPLLSLLPALLWAGLLLSRASARRRVRDLDGRDHAICGRPAFVGPRAWCAAGAALAAAVAVLQPVWGEGAGEPVGPDVVLCLDASRSMAARDVAPSRFDVALREIEALAAAGPGTRLALVAYAGDAHLLAPLTSDLPSVAAIASTLAPGTVGRGGTDLGAAIDAGLAALQRGRSTSGSIVVLGDGEDFAARGAAAAARALAAGVPVHCIGFGTEGGSKLVVAGDGGDTFLRDVHGVEVVTRLERAQLEAVATAGGGRHAMGDGTGALAALHADVLVPGARGLAARDPARSPPHRFQWPLLAAVLFWMLRLVMPERVR